MRGINKKVTPGQVDQSSMPRVRKAKAWDQVRRSKVESVFLECLGLLRIIKPESKGI